MRGLLVVALVAACWGSYEFYIARQLDAHGVTTSASVVDVDNGRYPYLRAQYTAEGRALEERTRRFSDEQAGEVIDIVYDETYPTRFQTTDFVAVEGSYTGPVILYGTAAVSALGALAVVLYRRRPPRRRRRR